MFQNIGKRLLSLVLAFVMVLSMIPATAFHVHAASGSLTMDAEGLIASYSGDTAVTGGGSTATVSQKSNPAIARSSTLTLSNNNDVTGELTFDYTVSIGSNGTATIDGKTVTTGGSFSKMLEPTDYVNIKVSTSTYWGLKTYTTSITITSITFTPSSTIDTTFNAPENGTYTVNGNSVTENTTISQESGVAYTFVATPATGYSFVGWYSTTVGGYISYNASESVYITEPTTIYPVFVDASLPVLNVGGNTYYDLASANEAAKSGGNKMIVVQQGGTVPAGTYEISKDVQLLIPFDAAWTANFSDETTTTTELAGQSMYSCLTLAEGAVINCYGAINVNAKQYASSTRSTGRITGAYGAIHMNSGSQINMKSGSNLYAYGYIGGQGKVWGEAGSSIYQLLQIEDWRGGSDSSGLLSKLKNNSFLFSQYYFQNIETTLRLDSGCTMYGSAAIAAGLTDSKSPEQTCAALVGYDEGMFHVTSGYAELKYNAANDRMTLDFYGDMVTDAISMKMNLTGLISSSMNTKDYILALPMNYTINIKSGSKVNFAQKFKLLPGTVVNIEADASATIGGDGALYLYDVDDWNSGTYTYNGKLFQVSYVYANKGAPATRTVTQNATLRVDGTLVANGPIYSTKHVENGGDAGITGSGSVQIAKHGSVNLKEVVGSSTQNLTEITCVPVVASIVGNEGKNSLAVGTYKVIDSQWYQYALSLTDVTYVSGGYQAADGKVYVANTKDTAVSVAVTSAQDCIKTTNGTVVKGAEDEFTITGITADAVVSAAAHTEEEIAKVEPTCEGTGLEAGVKCSVCGEIITAQETIPALGHTPVVDEAKAPTCTETGLTEGSHCSVCGKILVAQEVVPALGHTDEAIAGKTATCTETGLTAGVKCSVCGTITTAQEETAAQGHDHSVVVEGSYKAPTCTEAGKESDMKCSRCDDVVTGAAIEATGHNHSVAVEGSAKAPTCTEDGKEADLKCVNCDDVKTGATIAATGHDYAGVVTNPTCTEGGYTTYTCADCDHSYTADETAALGHTYSAVEGTSKAPTCTEAGKESDMECIRCDDTVIGADIEAIGHKFESFVTAPTCTEGGYTTHICANCGDSYMDSRTDVVPHNYSIEVAESAKAPTCTEEGKEADLKCANCDAVQTGAAIKATGHGYGAGVVTTAPTCTDKGVMTYTCSCGHSYTEEIAAKGHAPLVDKAVAPTCTETGLTEGSHCDTCGETLVAQETVEALGHNYVAVVTKPTCTDKGYTTHTCSRCGDSYVDSETAPVGSAHEYEEADRIDVAPTCTQVGYTLDVCKHCDHQEMVEGTEVAATGHSENTEKNETVYGYAATCTADGLSNGTKCENCGENDWIKAQEVIPATGHSHAAVVTAPTCTEGGYTTYTCRCGDSYVADYVDATGHHHEAVVTNPTCTEQGYTTYTCGCGDTYVAAESYKPALGHQYEYGVVSPTCTEQGYTVMTCEICGHVYIPDEGYTPAHGHPYQDEITTAPTCTEKGVKTYTCEACGDTYTEEIAATGHSFTDVVTDPTCTEQGYTTRSCACGYSYKDSYMNALGHDCVPTVTSPTCTEQGYTTHNCSRCDYSHIPADSYKPALGHQFEVAVMTPTCLEPGYTVATCMDCNHVYIGEETYTDPTGHHYDEGVVTEPKCHEEGYTTYTCQAGDHSYTADHTVALGCDFGEWTVVTPATCTTEGEQRRTCSRCEHFETEVLAVIPHSYTGVVTPPTCTEGGYETFTCVCGDTYTANETEATGHTEVVDEAKAPTCTETGLTEGSHCETCGEVIVAQEEIPMLEHSFGDWGTIKLATCLEAGEEGRTCSVCGHSETRSTGTSDHSAEVVPAVAARYDAEGLTEGSRCTVCGSTLVEQQSIPKLVLTWDTFLEGLEALEYYAQVYAEKNPGKDAVKLMINFLRTGVDRYNDDSWETLAGAPETTFIKDVLAYDDLYGTHAYALREMDKLKLTAPNGEKMEFDHLFGALNVSSKSNYSANNTDFGSWVGDLCDLMIFVWEGETFKGGYNEDSFTLDELLALVNESYFAMNASSAFQGSFGLADIRADLDVFYFVDKIKSGETSLLAIFKELYTPETTDEARAAYFLNNRFPGSMTNEEVRASIYNTYKDNILVQMLEASRGISGYPKLREACAYAFADYLFEKADGKLVAPEEEDKPGEGEGEQNKVYEVFSSTASTLAPGVSQTINYAVDSNGNQMVFYMATANINRDDVNVYANYANNDPSKGWEMSTVSEQMKAAQDRHSNPDDAENYIANYNVVAGQNANFYNMTTGEPNGLLVMDGVTYSANKEQYNFFAILDDGTPIIAYGTEYNTYKNRIQEAVAGGQVLVKDGVNVMDPANTNKMPRSCVGITGDGQIVTLVVDGRQAGFSVGATYYELAQIFVDAGCVMALELDGGGSATYDAKPEGSDEIVVVNRPNDMYERSVASSLIVVSTAFVSDEFHHAVLSTATDYITIGSSFDVSMVGASSSGHAAEIPAGAYLQVSDTAKGSIEGNTFTALAVGKVEIQLVVDGTVVGTKSVNVIRRPTALKFTESNLNAVYGVAEELPLVATYNNSPVTINAAEISFEMSNAAAGVMDGFAFVGTESSGVRNVTITAKVATDSAVSASMSLRLYSANESIFDFENADTGNTSLAWNRDVVNTSTIDKKNYYTTTAGADVHVNYTFAIDMKALEAPVRLQPLMEYLKGFAGGVGDNAQPWDYLLALGKRVSELTTISIYTTFPEGVEVNIDNISFNNDYLVIRDYTYNEATRTMVINCSWVKQTAAIDPSTANSIAILSGVKLIPTEEAKDESGKTQIDVVGRVEYDIYLDAGQLYDFARDEANQKQYGILPYENPADPEDKGGHFADTYINFEDHFAIHDQALNGWVTGGADNDLYYYYVDNEMVTGIALATDREGSGESYYYDFGENGVCKGIYTGLFYDDVKGGWCYSKLGKLATGWQTIDGNWHYFLVMKDGLAATGTMRIAKPGITFEFDEYGMTKGAWDVTAEGTRYYYGPGYHKALNPGYLTLAEINGKTYNFDYDGYYTIGIHALQEGMSQKKSVYEFSEDGAMIRKITEEGIVECVDAAYYVNAAGTVALDAGLTKIGDYYYFIFWSGKIAKDWTSFIPANKVNGHFPAGNYTFGPDGKMEDPYFTGIRTVDSVDYYYLDGKIGQDAGLTKISEHYYFVFWSGKIAKDWTSFIPTDKTNGHFPAATYTFGSDGKMEDPYYTGLKNVDGVDYYFLNGKVGKDAGLVEIDGDYYYVLSSGLIVKDQVRTITNAKMNDYFAAGKYAFRADGTMVVPSFTGIVTIGDIDYYYLNGQLGQDAGIVQIGEDYYYVFWSGKIAKSWTSFIPENKANGLFPADQYTFDADGKMEYPYYTGIRNVDGVDYYFYNGKIGKDAGLVKVDDDYYYVLGGGTLIKDQTKKIAEEKMNGHFVAGKYTFRADGTMVVPTFTGIVTVGGITYYYLNGQIGQDAGLVKVEDDFYYVFWSGKIAKDWNSFIPANKTNGYFPADRYTFGADGRMEDPYYTGIKNVDGVDYYYLNGKIGQDAGLTKIDEDYYFVFWSGKIAKNWTSFIPANKTNGYYPAATYTFASDGKMVKPTVVKPQVPAGFTGIWTVDDIGYYYVDGKLGQDAGLVQVDGHYYYVFWSGKIAKNWTSFIPLNKMNGLLTAATTLTFDAEGRMIAF